MHHINELNSHYLTHWEEFADLFYNHGLLMNTFRGCHLHKIISQFQKNRKNDKTKEKTKNKLRNEDIMK